MAIEVGKDVVAIRDHCQGVFKKGQIFKCLGIRQSACVCKHLQINIGVSAHSSVYHMPNGCSESTGKYDGVHWFGLGNFRALDDITPSIEEIIKEIAPLELINH